MSLYGQDYKPLPKGRIDELLAEGYSRYYIYHIKKDVEEAVGTIEVFLNHYVQVPPLAGHLHKVEGMHLVMSLYNKLKEWQQKRKQMRDTFSDECMNEKDCKHALGVWHEICIKVRERLNYIKEECPQTYLDDRSAALESSALFSNEIQDYEKWCEDPNFDPSENPWVLPYILKPFINGVFAIPNLDKYSDADDPDDLSALEDNHIENSGDYRTMREASSQISMVDIYMHLYRIVYSINICFVGVYQDDQMVRMGNNIPEGIASLSLYRSYSADLVECLNNKLFNGQDNVIDKELSDWCETYEYRKNSLSPKQEIEFYTFLIKRYKGLIDDKYSHFNTIRKGFIANDNSVNIHALAPKVYHEKGADEFLKNCLIINYARNRSKQLKQPKQKEKQTSSRTSPTYALSDYGKKKEAYAKKCATKAYVNSWGSGYMNAYLIRALFEKRIIKNLKATPAVRLLIYWELFDGNVESISDNIDNKLKQIKAENPELWTVDPGEISTYNDILDAFEDNFPTPING